jgi:hypothetical protein
MRPHKNLIKLQKAAIKRLTKLEHLSNNILSISSNREIETLLTYITIETLNTWSNFSRSFYLSCTLSAKTVSGKKIIISSTIANFNDAVGLVIPLYKRSATPNHAGIWHRRHEPTWHDPNVIMKICNHIGCSNITQIQLGFSGGLTVFKNLPTFRNFYAHRNQQTEYAAMQIATQYGISNLLKPSQILLSLPLNRRQILLLEWIDELRLTVEYLCYE